MSEPVADIVTVRPARAEEHQSIGALSIAAYLADGQLTKATDRYAGVLADVAGRVEHGTVLAAVDEAAGALLGTVTFVLPGSPLAELARPGEAEFRMLAVAPWAQRRGVGTALAAACVRRATELDAHAIVICTRDFAVTAFRMYQRLGFRRTPDRDWSPMPGVNLHALRLDLASGG